MIWQAQKKVYSCIESYIQDTRQYKFRTIGSEVSSFVDNPVLRRRMLRKMIDSNWVFHKRYGLIQFISNIISANY